MAKVVQLSEFAYWHNLASKAILLGSEVLTEHEKLMVKGHFSQCRICRLRTLKLAESQVRIHPERDELFAFTFPDQYFTLDDEEWEIISFHLSTCADCRDFVSLLNKLDLGLSS